MEEPPVLTREAAREVDRRAIQDFGIPSTVLMENAGRACADEARVFVGEGGGSTLVFCGPGNNGADGFVIARTLHNRGRDARVVFVGDGARLRDAKGDFALNLDLWRRSGGAVAVVQAPEDLAALGDALGRASLVVDALFGTGLTRALGEPWASCVRAINAAPAPVLAVDLPSGLDANTGAVLGEAVRADVTVTFVARKPGFGLANGPACVGRVVVAEIGVPRAFVLEAADRA